MIIFNIEKIKGKLRSGLDEKEGFKYLLVIMVIFSILMMPTIMSMVTGGIYDTLAGIFGVLTTIFGTMYVFTKNNGANGKHFLERYLALGFVLSIRFVLSMLLIGFCLGIITTFFSEAFINNIFPEDGSMSVYDLGGIVIFDLLYYWRLGVHMSDVAK